LIKDEGAFALVSVLSTFQLNDYETNWKSKQEQQRNRLLEYLVSFKSLYSKNSPKNFNFDFNNIFFRIITKKEPIYLLLLDKFVYNTKFIVY